MLPRFYVLFVFLLTWYSFEEFGAKELKPDGGGAIALWYALYVVLTIALLLFIMRDFVLDIKDLRKAELVKQGGISVDKVLAC